MTILLSLRTGAHTGVAISHTAPPSILCHCEERSDVAIFSPAVHRAKEEINSLLWKTTKSRTTSTLSGCSIKMKMGKKREAFSG